MDIIPTPKKVTMINDKMDYLAFAPDIKNNEKFSNAIDSFVIYAERIYGIAITKEEDAPMQVIYEAELASEEYRLVVNEEGVVIYASDSVGANHAFATVLQIMNVSAEQILLPTIIVEDAPDCIYRGMMIDLARNWHTFPYLLSYVDMCYFYKMSVLQLHFTDDQSYTLPSKIFPKLSTLGRFYTQEQIKELVEYANARGVELMPEIDVPGHCISFGEAYGDLFGTKGVICQHEDSMEAMRELFRELCDMFPYSKYIHIGGDEAYAMDEWTKCPQCCEYAKSVGIDSDMEDKRMLAELLYAHFISETAEVIFEKGKQPIVWEGFAKDVNNKVSKDIWVMSWENLYQLTSDLLEAGFKVINCSWIPTYVVTPLQMWSPKEVFDWSVYSWRAKAIKSPIHETGYESPKTSQILGGQLLAWGDHISTKCPSVEEGVYEERDRMLERLPMTAENTWNIEKVTDYASFEKTITVPQEKLFKMIGNTRRDISCI
ncbi:MAG: family 20 glycosylhydrolase [Faecalimonas sp.]|nr:family 20 glycosylhydrolase [Faecalimonas sp.]